MNIISDCEPLGERSDFRGFKSWRQRLEQEFLPERRRERKSNDSPSGWLILIALYPGEVMARTTDCFSPLNSPELGIRATQLCRAVGIGL